MCNCTWNCIDTFTLLDTSYVYVLYRVFLEWFKGGIAEKMRKISRWIMLVIAKPCCSSKFPQIKRCWQLLCAPGARRNFGQACRCPYWWWWRRRIKFPVAFNMQILCQSSVAIQTIGKPLIKKENPDQVFNQKKNSSKLNGCAFDFARWDWPYI